MPTLLSLSRGHLVALVMMLFALITQAGGRVIPENLQLASRAGNVINDLPNNEPVQRDFGASMDWGGILPDLRPPSTRPHPFSGSAPSRGSGVGGSTISGPVFDQ